MIRNMAIDLYVLDLYQLNLCIRFICVLQYVLHFNNKKVYTFDNMN